MATKPYWRQAILASCLVHCLLLAGAGWLGGGLLASTAEPQTIEMELVSQALEPEPPDSLPAALPAAAPRADKIPAPAVKAPEVVQPVSQPVAVNEVAMESFVPVMPAAGAAGQDSDSRAVTAAAGGGAGAAGATASGRIAGPRILQKVDPVYPESARKEGVTGSVGVRIEVLESGRPGQVELQRSSGRASLDQAALDAVRRWRFVPAQVADTGRPVRCYTTLSVVFKLN